MRISAAITAPNSTSTSADSMAFPEFSTNSHRCLTCEVDAVSDADWDAIAAEFEDVSFEQTAAYTSARWGAKKTSHLLLRRDGKVIAAAGVVQLTLPGTAKGIAYVKFGPMWRRRGEVIDQETYRAILNALVEEYCERRGLLLSILARPNPTFGAVEQALLEEHVFTRRRGFEDCNRYLVDLSLDEDEQRASLGQTWRRNLKKAQTTGLEISLGSDETKIGQFVDLHAHMVDRKNAAYGDAIHLLPKLLRELPPPLQPKFVIASHEDTPVAGAVIALHGDIAYYVYGATNSKALPMRAGFALQWWIVRHLAEQAPRWYDLGGTAGNSGLCQFKSGLVGSRGKIFAMPGEFDRWARLNDRVAGDALFSLRTIAKAMSGRLPVRVAR